MTTGGTADDADAIRVDLQAVRIRAEPADGGLAIVQILRPRRPGLGGERVVDAHAHIAVKREVGADVDLPCRALVTARPAAAVDDQHRGRALSGGKIVWQV